MAGTDGLVVPIAEEASLHDALVERECETEAHLAAVAARPPYFAVRYKCVDDLDSHVERFVHDVREGVPYAFKGTRITKGKFLHHWESGGLMQTVENLLTQYFHRIVCHYGPKRLLGDKDACAAYSRDRVKYLLCCFRFVTVRFVLDVAEEIRVNMGSDMDEVEKKWRKNRAEAAAEHEGGSDQQQTPEKKEWVWSFRRSGKAARRRSSTASCTDGSARQRSSGAGVGASIHIAAQRQIKYMKEQRSREREQEEFNPKLWIAVLQATIIELIFPILTPEEGGRNGILAHLYACAFTLAERRKAEYLAAAKARERAEREQATREMQETSKNERSDDVTLSVEGPLPDIKERRESQENER